MYNGKLLHDRLRNGNNRFRRAMAEGKDDAVVVREFYLAALCRSPSAKELQLSLAHLSAAKDRNAAMEDIAWAILNKTEFLFQH